MTTVKIKGMRCGHCVGSVTKALEAIDGITNVKVDLAKGEAAYEESKPVAIDKIRGAIDAIGFEVE
ncbi:MAG TPA: cation transporter [Desulfurivibrionaceae bacterium]|nr:cation transporter [Desulfurivibrionaceae bacterium]